MSNFKNIVENAHLRKPLTEIERFSASEFVSQFEQISKSGNPVIFSSEPTLNSLRELEAAIGEHPLKLRIRNFDSSEKYDPRNRSYSESTVSQFVDLIEQETADSYAGNIVFDGDAENIFGVGVPEVIPPTALRKPSIWLGPKGSVTPLHRDSADNFAFHIFGSKRWTLFPPEQHPHLGILSLEGLQQTGGEFAISEIDFEDPDLERFPEFENAKPSQVELNTRGGGEVLFLPAGWHHHVRTLDTSLMLNYWVEDPSYSAAFLRGVKVNKKNRTAE